MTRILYYSSCIFTSLWQLRPNKYIYSVKTLCLSTLHSLSHQVVRLSNLNKLLRFLVFFIWSCLQVWFGHPVLGHLNNPRRWQQVWNNFLELKFYRKKFFENWQTFERKNTWSNIFCSNCNIKGFLFAIEAQRLSKILSPLDTLACLKLKW